MFERVSGSLANSAIDTLMTVAQPAMNPVATIWGTPDHVYFKMIVDVPSEPSEADMWRINFSANRFHAAITNSVRACLSDIQEGNYERLIEVR